MAHPSSEEWFGRVMAIQEVSITMPLVAKVKGIYFIGGAQSDLIASGISSDEFEGSFGATSAWVFPNIDFRVGGYSLLYLGIRLS